MNLRRPGVSLLVLLCGTATSSPARAQDLEPGSRIRVLTRADRVPGELVGALTDSLLIRPDGHFVSRAVCVCDVSSLEIARGGRPLWLPFGLVGAAAGALLAEPVADSGLVEESFLLTGLVVMATLAAAPVSPWVARDDEDAQARLIGAVIGAGVGAALGLRVGRERWEPVTDWRAIVPSRPQGGPAR